MLIRTHFPFLSLSNLSLLSFYIKDNFDNLKYTDFIIYVRLTRRGNGRVLVGLLLGRRLDLVHDGLRVDAAAVEATLVRQHVLSVMIIIINTLINNNYSNSQ